MKQVAIGIIKRVNKQNKLEVFLISSRRDFGEFTGYYYPPGGHVEEGEDVKSALVRELKEELGVEVTVIGEIAVTPGDVKDQMTHWWECHYEGDFVLEDEELADGQFFTSEQVKNLNVWPATRKVLEKYVFN